MIQNSCVPRELVSMKESTSDYLMILHRQYMAEVGKFIKALKDNAPRNELILIRTNVKKLLAEIRRFPISGSQNEVKPQ
jgi:hypothetical protein